MTPEQQMAIESAAWRTLVGHLQKRTDVQNIDLMNLAGFCRNCLSRWYQEAAEAVQDLDAEVDALGHRPEYAYDEMGNLVRQTDANDHSTTYEDDALGRRVATVLPLGSRKKARTRTRKLRPT